MLLAAITAFFALDLQQYTTLDYIKSQQNSLQEYYSDNKLLMLAIFGGIYVAVTALSLPAATILTLLAGALFGFPVGLLMVSFASTIGATLAFLMARTLLGSQIQEKYNKNLVKINEGFKKEGAFYLFALRLVPAFPFFIVNLVMGLLPIRTLTFYWVSQIGMLPGTAVYVFAGTKLADINSLADIASPSILLSFALLGLFPIIAKKILTALRTRS